MAGLQDPNVIDLVGQDADGSVLLVMVEERPWGSDPNQPRQLREKINAYAGYALDGTLTTQYPEATGQRLRIQLGCPQEPVGEIVTITSHAAAELQKLGIDFAIKVLP